MIETPGHSHDHVSYLVSTPSRRILIAGDALFCGGKVAIQDIDDCNIGAVCETVRRLATIEFDTLLPGHLHFSLRDARRHADAALAYVGALRLPALDHLTGARAVVSHPASPPKIIAERPPSTVIVVPVM